jgi:predicted enzyme related to lactoylglutathione lyase
MPDMKLELVPVPVSDIDRAKAFYVDQVGFNADHDVQPNEMVRIVQLTPPGSGCSILLSKGLPGISEMQPGIIKALHLVVKNIGTVREEMISRGVEMGEIMDMGGVLYAGFSDPDGNSWLLQELLPRP